MLTEIQQQMCLRDYSCLLSRLAPIHPATPFYQEYGCSQPETGDKNIAISTSLTVYWALKRLVEVSLKCLYYIYIYNKIEL